MPTLPPSPSPTQAIVGYVLLGTALLSILAMAHHPDGSGSLALVRGVHGGLILLSLVLLAGLWEFSARLGLGTFAVKAALTAYSFGIFGACLAATINGFAVPALIDGGVSDKPIFQLAWALNQALAYESAFAVAAASLLWGVTLLRRTSMASRGLGLAGLLTGAVPVGLLAAGWVDLHVSGALIVYAAHWLFCALVGAWMVFARDARAQRPWTPSSSAS